VLVRRWLHEEFSASLLLLATCQLDMFAVIFDHEDLVAFPSIRRRE
jgi:hypothetical protein